MTQKIVKSKSASKGHFAYSKGLMDRVREVEKNVPKTEFPDFKAGDTIRVHARIIEGEKERLQAFEGMVIKRDNRSFGKTFTVRKISHGVGVERIFLETSPKIAKVELIQRGKVRRAKLYFVRDLVGRAAKLNQEFVSEGTAASTVAAEMTRAQKLADSAKQ